MMKEYETKWEKNDHCVLHMTAKKEQTDHCVPGYQKGPKKDHRKGPHKRVLKGPI